MPPSQVKNYVDNNLNPTKVNVTDPTKDNFTQPFKQILDEFEFPKDDHNRGLSLPKENFELHLKRQPNSCLVNSYFDFSLKIWQANM